MLTLHEPGWCEQCGKRLPDLRHWRRIFCDRKCLNDYFNGLTAKARAEERARLKCVVCGEPITGAKRSHQKYCSERCRQKARIRCEAVDVAPLPK